MIVLNRILDLSLYHSQVINDLKVEFWNRAKNYEVGFDLQTIFNQRKGNGQCLDKEALERSLGLNSLRGRFVDWFFYLNSQNENFMTLRDFSAYMTKFIRTSDTIQKVSLTKSISEMFNEIMAAEQIFFEEVEPLKLQFKSSFGFERESIGYLRLLFEDMAVMSLRSKVKIVDFNVFNRKLRMNQNFALLSVAEYSFLQNYFSLNCDSGLSLEEFVFIFTDIQEVLGEQQAQLNQTIGLLNRESFLSLNALPSVLNINFNN